LIYFADLHIHSRYSRATSRDCILPELARWSALKGILVCATGDFTHPEWSREIREMLTEDEEGLFRLKQEFIPCDVNVPNGFGPGDVRFILNVEISSIYKRGGATRKVHNLVFMPDLDSMERFTKRLERIGNVRSDGRPILGLDSRDLLEISLETTADSFIVPAHVWTPWFSILGSRSGFDSVEECFGDLAPHIFALETGLSSDPEMNHRVSSLDRFTLLSNSDTHSPSKLGREANVLRGRLGYTPIREAISEGGRATYRDAARNPEEGFEAVLESVGGEDAFIGTVEFFPEEGKYHLDGHRKCGVRLDPQETAKLGGKCPVCGHGVTVGVMNRVIELADSPLGRTPHHAAPFWRMIPLREIVAQAMGVGPQSKKVEAVYQDLLRNLGAELKILWSLPLDEIQRHAPEIIVEGVRRARIGEVSIKAGFDGEYGTVELFGPGERERLAGQSSFLPTSPPRRSRSQSAGTSPQKKRQKKDEPQHAEPPAGEPALNEEQQAAVAATDRPVLVQAGPGTGKTRTLTHRIATLIRSAVAEPGAITAVTFTRKAAQEMRERLERLLPPEEASGCWVGTFHQLGARILEIFRDRGLYEGGDRTIDEDEALTLFRQACREAGLDRTASSWSALFEQTSLLKQNLTRTGECTENPDLGRAYLGYEELLRREKLLDLDDLLVRPVRLLEAHPGEARRIGSGVARWLLVDEFQDVNRAQYEMVRLLTNGNTTGLFAIGDPDQAIYGFRGADREYFLKFHRDFPESRVVRLNRNYRSRPNILTAARQVIDPREESEPLISQNPTRTPIMLVTVPNEAIEGKYICRTIESLIGGASFFAMDSGRVRGGNENLGFRDFAVLFRLNAVGDALEEEFLASGIPFQRARTLRPREEAEAFDPRAEAVTLMTIHAAKGLEFPVVFVAGCEDGIVPYTAGRQDGNRQPDLEEERRLLYVAMTRAADYLFLIRSLRRTLFGMRLESPETRFLKTVDRSICQCVDPLTGNRTPFGGKPKQCELFS